MQLQNKVQNTTFFGTIPLKPLLQPETQKLIETERWRVFLVSYFTFVNLCLEKKDYETLCQEKNLSVLLNGVRSIRLSPLSLCVLHFSFLNTLCSFSIISQSVCLTGIVWRKKGKRKTRRDTQLSSTTDWNCKVILKSERRAERRDALWHVCLTPAVCVCVCV